MTRYTTTADQIVEGDAIDVLRDAAQRGNSIVDPESPAFRW